MSMAHSAASRRSVLVNGMVVVRLTVQAESALRPRVVAGSNKARRRLQHDALPHGIS